MNGQAPRRAIGGELELAGLGLGDARCRRQLTGDVSGTWTASGRAALALTLRELQRSGVRHVHLPAYLCESVLRPIQALGMAYSFYPVDAQLSAHPDPPRDAAVLVIHYFGWINSSAVALRREAGRSFYLVEDVSHAVLSNWAPPVSGSRSVFFSVRKLLPAPLGGWCSVEAELDEPSAEVEALTWRSLAARLARGWYLAEPDGPVDARVEDFYLSAFRAVEAFLDNHPTYAPVPRVALDIIAGADWKAVSAARRANWQVLHALLADRVDPLTQVLPHGVVPLGFPVTLAQRDTIRARLASQRIFCPVHWRLPTEVEPRRFPAAARLAETSLTLPLDQRYGADEMERMAAALQDCL